MKFSHHLPSKQTHPFQMFPAKVETISPFFPPTPWLRSLPPCLLLASLSSQEELVQWSFDVKIIEGADPCNGGNKKEEEIIWNFQDPGQTPACKLCVSLPKLSSFALSLSAGGCWESGPARYRLGESGEGVQEGLALFTFVPLSQEHADHMGSYCGRMC